jgi:hypothetical protein
MKLQVQPLVPLADEKVRFAVTRLPPSAKVKISSRPLAASASR